MQRVARVLLTVDDADLKRWAEEDEQTVEEVISDLKNQVVELLDNDQIGDKVSFGSSARVEFIEWEDFCPKCESTDLRWDVPDRHPYRRTYRCTDCGHEFTEEEMKV